MRSVDRPQSGSPPGQQVDDHADGQLGTDIVRQPFVGGRPVSGTTKRLFDQCCTHHAVCAAAQKRQPDGTVVRDMAAQREAGRIRITRIELRPGGIEQTRGFVLRHVSKQCSLSRMMLEEGRVGDISLGRDVADRDLIEGHREDRRSCRALRRSRLVRRMRSPSRLSPCGAPGAKRGKFTKSQAIEHSIWLVSGRSRSCHGAPTKTSLSRSRCCLYVIIELIQYGVL